MDLKTFYLQNIKEFEYHHRFLNSIKKANYTSFSTKKDSNQKSESST